MMRGGVLGGGGAGVGGGGLRVSGVGSGGGGGKGVRGRDGLGRAWWEVCLEGSEMWVGGLVRCGVKVCWRDGGWGDACLVSSLEQVIRNISAQYVPFIEESQATRLYGPQPSVLR